MRRTLNIAICVLLLPGISGFIACSTRSQDRSADLRLTITALRHATSWHEEYDGPGTVSGSWAHRVSDVICSAGEHTIADETGSDPNSTHFEIFLTPFNSYYHRSDGWLKWGTGRPPACSSEPQLRGTGVALPLEQLLRDATIRAGVARSVGSEPCRDYDVKEIWSEFTICINENDHLPREVVSSFFKDETGQLVKAQRATYSHWNTISATDFPTGLPVD